MTPHPLLSQLVASPSALVVEPSLADAAFIASVLATTPFQVTMATDFRHAKALLEERLPTLLITEIRLGAFNGLHLVLRSRTDSPETAALVTSEMRDPVLEREAESLGATFVQKPLTEKELKAAIYRTVLQPVVSRGVDVIRAPFERRHEERRRGIAAAAGPDRRIAERRLDLASVVRRAIYG
jgi:DNA-binding response OmpR family regulator